MSQVMRKPAYAYANNKGADQPAHPRSLISTFVVCCLDTILHVSLVFYIRNFKPLASFCDCTDRFESYLVENPEDRFSRNVAQIDFFRRKNYMLSWFKNILKYPLTLKNPILSWRSNLLKTFVFLPSITRCVDNDFIASHAKLSTAD